MFQTKQTMCQAEDSIGDFTSHMGLNNAGSRKVSYATDSGVGSRVIRSVSSFDGYATCDQATRKVCCKCIPQLSYLFQVSTDAPSTLAAVRRRRFARNSTTGPPDLNRSIDLAVAEHEERNKNSFANNYKSFSFNKADEKHLIRPKTKNVAFTFMWFLRAGGLCQFATAMISSLVQGSLFTSWAIILALECEVREFVR